MNTREDTPLQNPNGPIQLSIDHDGHPTTYKMIAQALAGQPFFFWYETSVTVSKPMWINSVGTIKVTIHEAATEKGGDRKKWVLTGTAEVGNLGVRDVTVVVFINDRTKGTITISPATEQTPPG